MTGVWQKLPSKIPTGKKQSAWVKEITKDNVLVETVYFTDIGVSSAPESQTLKMMMFMPFPITPEMSTVYLDAFAVQDSLTEVNSIVNIYLVILQV